MSINYAKQFNARVTPQSQPIPGLNQVRNSGGGYARNKLRVSAFVTYTASET